MRLFSFLVRFHNVEIETYHVERTENRFYRNNQHTFISFKHGLFFQAVSYIMSYESFLHIKHT